MNVIKLSQSNFDDAVAKNDLVVIDFWATWCVPCKSFEKVVLAVAEKYSDVTFASVDIDAEKTLAEEFHIRSVPSIMILREQVVVFAESGALTVSALSELIDQAKALDPEELKKATQEEQGE